MLIIARCVVARRSSKSSELGTGSGDALRAALDPSRMEFILSVYLNEALALSMMSCKRNGTGLEGKSAVPVKFGLQPLLADRLLD